MPQDAFTLRYAALELDGALAGGHINRINQQGRDEVALLVYTGKRTVRLVLNTGASDCGAYFFEGGDNPLVAPNFCMLLRKHLQGGTILGVSLVGFERILCFRILATTDFSSSEKLLYLEVMGKYSNLILAENGVILGALKLAPLDGNAKRVILPGAPYVLPPPQDKADPRDLAALSDVLGGSLDNLVRRVAGVAPRTAEQIKAGYRGGDPAAFVHSFLFLGECAPCVVYADGVPVDFSVRAEAGGVPYPSLLDAMTAYYTASRGAKAREARRRTLLSAVHAAVKKYEKRLGQIADKQRECADCERLRTAGELILSNLYALRRGMKAFEATDYTSGNAVKIVLDPMLSPSDNAQSYFKRYRKQKRALEMLAPQEEEVRAELEYLYSLRAAAESARQEEDFSSLEEEFRLAGLLKADAARQKKKEEIPFRAYECDGFRIWAGRNNLQNDRLVRRASPDDLWLHAQRYHSCHAVILSGGREVSERAVAFAAAVCAKYSDAHGDKIPVDCCAVKFVKKPPKSKAGFVTYSSFRTVLGDPALLDIP